MESAASLLHIRDSREDLGRLNMRTQEQRVTLLCPQSRRRHPSALQQNVTELSDNWWNPLERVSCFLETIIKPAINRSLNGEPWNNSIIGVIDNTAALEPATSAYLNFTTLKRCFVGATSNCTGNLTDGLVLEVCAPVYHSVGANKRAIMDGEVVVVNISRL